ncbi:YdaS family helix-turn-helix protein [Comamonas sp. w2-DMI]|uniref:transcriptional regulator n=1 Tax=Comamonas sp. w2-DMI TaxID=3126391 RepID=UPI0032E5198B
MKLNEYILTQGRGAIGRLAASIGAHAPDVSRWISGKRPIPEKAAVAIETATRGAVTRPEMRPDDWQDIWPELALPAHQQEAGHA